MECVGAIDQVGCSVPPHAALPLRHRWPHMQPLHCLRCNTAMNSRAAFAPLCLMQGTQSTRFFLYDRNCQPLASAQVGHARGLPAGTPCGQGQQWEGRCSGAAGLRGPRRAAEGCSCRAARGAPPPFTCAPLLRPRTHAGGVPPDLPAGGVGGAVPPGHLGKRAGKLGGAVARLSDVPRGWSRP